MRVLLETKDGEATAAAVDPIPPYEFLSPADCAGAGRPDWVFRAASALLAEPSDAAISAILEAMGTASGSDRAWMFEYSADLTTFRNTHEWCRQLVSAHVQDLQDAPTTMFDWLHRQLVAGRAVMVNRVEGLPRAARTLQAEMLRQDDKSILAVPIAIEGRLRAAFGFDAVRRYHRWPEADVAALFQCAELIALARYRREGAIPFERSNRAAPLIYLGNARSVRGVEPAAIVCLLSMRNNTLVRLVDGSEFVDGRPLGIWAGLLSPASFVRVHRTGIVNLAHVTGVRRQTDSSWRVELRDQISPLPVSRSCRQELKARLGI